MYDCAIISDFHPPAPFNCKSVQPESVKIVAADLLKQWQVYFLGSSKSRA